MTRRGRGNKLLPGTRTQRPIPAGAANQLRKIPDRFADDGCTNSPDAWFGFDFSWACRIHDWRYCTRAQPDGSMSEARRWAADTYIRGDIKASLPWRWRWIRWVYFYVLKRFGDRAYDTCPEHFAAGVSRSDARRKVCRHGLTWPPPRPRPEGSQAA